jgi:predicted unusual protein kinase regulating ubiquinone biosynthesis (AarF/ABC1/UbiB family)
MQLVGIVTGCAGLLVVLAIVVGRRRAMARGRSARLLYLGSLSARMSTSWLGARLRRRFAGAEARQRIDAAQRKANAARVAETMGHMKGAFMKLGQMMSFVTDDVPEEFRAALTSLQTSAPPMELALLRDVAEAELKMPLERAFSRFDAKPLASASIGQVHRAALPTGEEVVVKIQYPGVADAIRADLDNVEVLYRMVSMFYPGVDAGPIVDEIRGRIGEELDYAREARNQRAFEDLYRGHPFIRVPRVIESHSTGRVLTSEFVEGRRWDDVLTLPDSQRQRYAEILFRFIFGSIARFGVFNGDPHPGNYLFSDEHVVFLDFGCVKYFPQPMRQDWRKLVTAHLSGDRQIFYGQLIALGFLRDGDGLDRNDLYDYFGYFYEPFHQDREFQFTREYNRQSFGHIFRPQGRFAPMSRKLNMPRDFVFVNRIQWGVVSLLAQLGASNNWHRIQREFLRDEPPSTELGSIDARFREGWRAQRQLEDKLLALTPDGIRAVG